MACGTRRNERGYILLTIILFVALLAIAMTAMMPVITRQIKRDREEELIHRGVQYSRAIQHYVKKFGRYPTKLEDLENTSNVRFLRKRYKDPVTGKDFKLLHVGEVQTSFGPGIGGATSVAAMAQGSAGGAFGNSALGGNSSFGGNSAFGGGNSFGGNSAFGGNNSGALGGSSFGGAANSAQSSGNTPQGTPNQGTDATNPEQQVSGQPNQADSSANKVFGGGPIMGVASTSKDKTIRIFNKKERYYQWQFIYDPSSDTGGLITTPYQPGMTSAAGIQPASQGQSTQSSPFGTQGSSFGQGSAFGQGASSGLGGGFTSSSPMQPAPSQPQPQGPQSSFPPDQAPQQ